MSNLESKLATVVKNVCDQKDLKGLLVTTNTSLSDQHMSGSTLRTQHDIDEQMRLFATMTRLLMPVETVDEYVQVQCRAKSLPHNFPSIENPWCVPGWTTSLDSAPIAVLDVQGNLDRSASMLKFTEAEVVHALNIAEKSPDIPITFLLLQSMFENYCSLIRAGVGSIDASRAEMLTIFQDHFSKATNFLRFFMMGMSVCMKKTKPEDAFESVNQTLVTQVFDFLDSFKAFEIVTPDLSMSGVPPRRFSCPARPFLKEVMVNQQTYMHVVNMVRAVRNGEASNFDIPLYLAVKNVVIQTAKFSRLLIDTGGRDVYLTMINAPTGRDSTREM